MSEVLESTAASQWRAYLSEPHGWLINDPDEIAELFASEDPEGRITICRGTAGPTDEGRLSGNYACADKFLEIDLQDVEVEVMAETWELAQRAAWGMNQPPSVLDQSSEGAGGEDEIARLKRRHREELARVRAEVDGLVALTLTPDAGQAFRAALIYAANRIPADARMEGAADSHEGWLRWGASRLDAALHATKQPEADASEVKP